jgi:hypothetical protein
LTTPFVDFSAATTDARVTFDVAYARYSADYWDGLAVLASGDCGNSWDTVYFKESSALATTGDFAGLFVPTSSQWRTETIDLRNYAGSPAVMLSWVNVAGWGNALYLDAITVEDGDLGGAGGVGGGGGCAGWGGTGGIGGGAGAGGIAGAGGAGGSGGSGGAGGSGGIGGDGGAGGMGGMGGSAGAGGSGNAGGAGGAASAGGAAGGAGSGEGGTGTGANRSNADPLVGQGCNAAAPGGSGSGWWLLVALAVVCRRRR